MQVFGNSGVIWSSRPCDKRFRMKSFVARLTVFGVRQTICLHILGLVCRALPRDKHRFLGIPNLYKSLNLNIKIVCRAPSRLRVKFRVFDATNAFFANNFPNAVRRMQHRSRRPAVDLTIKDKTKKGGLHMATKNRKDKNQTVYNIE